MPGLTFADFFKIYHSSMTQLSNSLTHLSSEEAGLPPTCRWLQRRPPSLLSSPWKTPPRRETMGQRRAKVTDWHSCHSPVAHKWSNINNYTRMSKQKALRVTQFRGPPLNIALSFKTLLYSLTLGSLITAGPWSATHLSAGSPLLLVLLTGWLLLSASGCCEEDSQSEQLTQHRTSTTVKRSKGVK